MFDAEDYLAQHTVSPSGAIVYAPNLFDRLRQPLYWVTRQGVRTEVASNANYFAGPRISPDGELIATVCSDASGHLQVCIHDIRRGVLEWITRDANDAVVPVWHPSSERFALTRAIENNGIFSYGLDGGAFTRIHEDDRPAWPSSYSPDGQSLLFVRSPRAAVMEIWVLHDDGTSEPLVDTESANFCPRFDPTGEYFAYVSNESNRWEIYLKPFKKPGRRIQVSIDGGTDPVWAPDGSELFYRNGDTLMAVPIEHKQRIIVGQPAPLFDFPFGAKVSVYSPNFDVHPDGDRFVVTETTADTRGATELVVITNWSEELNRVLPPLD
jgi:Tol biopolymer transport system component